MSQTATSPTLDTLFGRILARRPRELALIDPGNKLRITGQTAEASHLRAGRPRDLGTRSAFHRRRIAGAFGDCTSVAEYSRTGADRACSASCRPRGRAVSAAVAAGRACRSAQPHQRAGDRHISQDRRRGAFRACHECRGGSLLDPACLRLRRRPAGRHGLARSGAGAALERDASRDPGRPQGRDHLLRCNIGRLSRGAAHASEPDRGRAGVVARKRRAAGRDRDVGFRAKLVCGPRFVRRDLASLRRHARHASSLRGRCARAGHPGTWLRHADCAGAACVPPRRDRSRRAPAELCATSSACGARPNR